MVVLCCRLIFCSLHFVQCWNVTILFHPKDEYFFSLYGFMFFLMGQRGCILLTAYICHVCWVLRLTFFMITCNSMAHPFRVSYTSSEIHHWNCPSIKYTNLLHNASLCVLFFKKKKNLLRVPEIIHQHNPWFEYILAFLHMSSSIGFHWETISVACVGCGVLPILILFAKISIYSSIALPGDFWRVGHFI